MFVVIEGIDGSGKTTLLKNLSKRLKRAGVIKVRTTKEPFLPVKSVIETLGNLTPEEIYRIFLIDRIVHVKRVIEPAMRRNEVVICDRYWFSAYVYQGEMGIDRARILKDNSVFPQPDLLVILEVSPQVAIERIRKRGGKDTIEEKVKFEKLIERYREVAELAKDMGIEVLVYNTEEGDNERIVEDIYEAIVKRLDHI